MAHLIGRRRYVGETYPSPPSQGGTPPSPETAFRIVWRLDGTGTAQTWSEVMTQLNAAKAAGQPAIEIFADEPEIAHPIPAGTYDVDGARLVSPMGRIVEITPEDGVEIQNLDGIYGGIILIGSNTTKALLTFPIQFASLVPPVFTIQGIQSRISQNGSFAMIDLTAGQLFQVALLDGASVSSGTATAAINLTGALLIAYVEASLENTGTIDVNSVSGDAPSSLGIVHDGSFVYNSQANFLGTISNGPYNLGGACGGGPTSFRPTGVFSSVPKGTIYWDNDLGYAVYWDGTEWLALVRHLVGTFASMPAPVLEGNGRRFVSTDGSTVFVGRGATWAPELGGTLGIKVPEVAAWANAFGAVAPADHFGSILFDQNAAGAITISGLSENIGAGTDYTVTVHVRAYLKANDGSQAGIVLRNSVAGSFLVFGIGNDAYVNRTRIVTYSGGASNLIMNDTLPYGADATWFRVVSVFATGDTFQVSVDGLVWTTVFTIAAGARGVVPDQVGIGINEQFQVDAIFDSFLLAS